MNKTITSKHRAGAGALITPNESLNALTFSTPAGKGSCPGMSFANGSICQGLDGKGRCYAMTGRAAMPASVKAGQARLDMWRNEPDAFETRFIDELTAWTSRGLARHFRWFSSGDAPDSGFVWFMCRMAREFPRTKFWFPTKTWRVKSFRLALVELAWFPNVTVRPSAIMLGEEAPREDTWMLRLDPGHCTPTTVDEALEAGCYVCPKILHHSSCGAQRCRQCWDKDSALPIGYPWHTNGHISKEWEGFEV